MLWLGRVLGSRLFRRSTAVQLRAIEGFVRYGTPRQLHGRREPLAQRLAPIASEFPDAVAMALLRIYQSEPILVPRHTWEAIERAWVTHADRDRFDHTWDALARMVPAGEDFLIGSLCAVVHQLGRDRIAQNFRRGAHRRAQARLSRPGPADGAGKALELLELVMFPEAGGPPPAYWQCMLGDAARHRGDGAEAIRRYRVAVEGGQAAARPRLAYLLALEGHRLLRHGELPLAIEQLRAAESLSADPDYQLLAVIARLLGRYGATEHIIRDLDGLRDTITAAATVDFWTGVAQFESGDYRAAASTWRRSFGAEQHADELPELTSVSTVLLQIAEGGEDGFVAGARELLNRHGTHWAKRSPISFDTVITQVADRDPDLLSRLVSALGEHPQLSRPTRMIAAHALLRSAVAASEAGLALNRLDVA
ncbi:MAG: tetratricopeptide repeat protein, partial [Actinomycetes bacterium]